jgi:hypothetical protein
VTAVESALERQLSVAIIDAKPRFRRLQAGRTLVQQGELGEELFLLFDGVLRVEVDGNPVTEVSPGAILGELALLQGRRTATPRAVTPAGSRSSPRTTSTGRHSRSWPRAACPAQNARTVFRSSWVPSRWGGQVAWADHQSH